MSDEPLVGDLLTMREIHERLIATSRIYRLLQRSNRLVSEITWEPGSLPSGHRLRHG